MQSSYRCLTGIKQGEHAARRGEEWARVRRELIEFMGQPRHQLLQLHESRNFSHDILQQKGLFRRGFVGRGVPGQELAATGF